MALLFSLVSLLSGSASRRCLPTFMNPLCNMNATRNGSTHCSHA